jgi:hypothetical protein
MQPPAPKKTSVWVWILGGVAIFFFAIMLTCGVVGYMGMRMIKSAGFDSELMKNNPGLAMAKMATAMNKNLEVLSSNDRSGTIVVRDKTTGKVTTLKFDPDTKKMVVSTDDGKQSSVTIDNSGLTATSADGSTVKYGNAAGNNVPSWVPVYPGSSPQGTVSATNGDTSQNTFTFKSPDPASKVIAFYSDQLKAAGLKVNMTTTSDQGGMLQAEDEGKKRTVIVTVGTSSEGSETGVNVIEKK